MHSFASVLIAATLTTLTSAYPIDTSPSTTVSTLSPLSTQISAGSIPSTDKTEISVIGTSVVGIFAELHTEIEFNTELMVHLTSSSLTVAEVSDAVSSINGSISTAIVHLQALIGQETVPAKTNTDDTGVTVSEVAHSVDRDTTMILDAAVHVLEVSKTMGTNTFTQVKCDLEIFSSSVTALIAAVIRLVPDVTVLLKSEFESYTSMVSDLDLTNLFVLLEITA